MVESNSLVACTRSPGTDKLIKQIFYELFVAESVERETGLEPATTCLEGRDSAN